MRVIAGTLRGRRFAVPRGTRTRPTSDRVREALFSILGSVEGLRVLDLFAGSGALAIEALSRGAAAATLVDSSSTAIAVIKRNLATLGLEAEVRTQPALRYLRTARIAARQYDLVLLDPPYDHPSGLSSELSAALSPVLAPEARVASESDRRLPLELDLPLRIERRYGDTVIRIHDPR
ncbi:MAG: 16S rRNA (guanine(966)-N(2))-methyltransferase RsmD [Solirubrobacterales bacterium]|nr:16S rRNA (guanine(966)-N(2))-methyltransferase RsmD [Solirubrobacterales bacterium]